MSELIPDVSTNLMIWKNNHECTGQRRFPGSSQAFCTEHHRGFWQAQWKTVGIIANQPQVLAGVLDETLLTRPQDSYASAMPSTSPGHVHGHIRIPSGTGQEYNGIIRHGAKLLCFFRGNGLKGQRYCQESIRRSLYSDEQQAPRSRHRVRRPSAEIAVMGPEGAANIIFKRNSSSKDPLPAGSRK